MSHEGLEEGQATKKEKFVHMCVIRSVCPLLTVSYLMVSVADNHSLTPDMGKKKKNATLG